MRELAVVLVSMATVAVTYTAILSIGTIVSDWVDRRRGRR